MSEGSTSTARLRLVATALLFSTGGAAIKACTLDGWAVASFRSGIAALAILAFVPAARRALSWRVLPLAVAYAATLVLFVLANKHTTSANAIFLQSTAPLYLVLLGPWLLDERLRARDVPFMLAIAAGLLMFFVGSPAPQRSAPDPALGNVLAAASGIAYALMLIGLRRGAKSSGTGASGLGAVVVGNVLACLATLPMALPVHGAWPRDAALIGFLGVFQIGLAYVLMVGAMPHVTALEASLLLLLEPMFNPLWSWLVHGEEPGAWAIGGSVLILGATAVRTVGESRR
jgi:DME family drug/metabolite transporter